MLSPSPTVSMLRSILWSLWSFLLRASRVRDVTSSGAGSTTLPLHSTCTQTLTSSPRPVRRVHVVDLHCRWQWCPLSERAPGTFHSIRRSWICRHRWTQSQRFQFRQLLSVHLQEIEMNVNNSSAGQTFITNPLPSVVIAIWSRMLILFSTSAWRKNILLMKYCCERLFYDSWIWAILYFRVTKF